MAFSSSDLSIKEFTGSDVAELKVQVSVTVLKDLSSKSTQDLEEGNSSSNSTEGNVPRADGGRDAWLFLAGCFVFEALIWGKGLVPCGILEVN